MVNVGAKDSSQNNLSRAVWYLQHVAYNSTLRLFHEAPRVASNTYWIASDNLLAFKALEPYDPQLSSTIQSELIRLAKFYNLLRSSDGLPLSMRYDVIINDNATLEIPPRNVTHMTLYQDSYTLKYDIANGTGNFTDWRKYADLRLLTALSDHNAGDEDNAISNFTAAENMWDGIGLRDLGFNNSYGEGQGPGNPNAYSTYKLGLLLYVSGKLGIHLPFESEVMNRIWLMQNQTSGGIFTHIMPDGSSGTSDTNTETTTMVILGITSITQNSTQPTPEFDPSTLMLCVVVLLSSLILQRIRRN